MHSNQKWARRRARRALGVVVPLLGCGALALGMCAWADGTAAGTTISNTATATYNDPNNPNQTLNSTSNTVSITVAEIAGITVTPQGVTDTSPATGVLPNDVINYDFLVSNVGNDPTRFFIPGAANVTGPGTPGTLQISTDGGSTWVNIPAAGVTTGSIAAAGSVRVRVPVTINTTAPSGAPVVVTLGNTGANDNSAGTQNQAFPTNPSGNDVNTVDNADGSVAGEAAGAPVNGEREASARQQILVGAQPQAFANVFLTRTNYTDSGTPALTDDVLTYGLSLQVNAAAPSGASPSLVPADLAGTTISVDGVNVTRVLVSDAIPTGTKLNAAPTGPAGWTVVYTTSPLTTTPQAAAWSATAPADLTTVTRVGWVANGPVTKGSAASGFTFKVVTSGVNPAGSTTIANIAQMFGQSAGDTSNALVYDESGDQSPSNFNDDGSAGSIVPTTGVANTGVDGIDTNNNNTGSGAGGEDNVYTLAVAGGILNGPNGFPAAVGPTDNNDDFTNQSCPIAVGIAPGTLINPAAVSFTNTISNPGTSGLTNILLVPTAPANPSDLPNGTTVLLSFNGASAVYTYNGTTFIFTSGTAIQVGSLGPGASVTYTAVVDLPANTPLSTDTGNGFPVPIRAFVDSNLNAVFDAGEAGNVTIDRVYTGFVRLVKDARILDTDGVTQIQAFSPNPSVANIRVGRYIEYRITYTNISTAPAGNGNVILNANSLVITEDGRLLPNNWARDNDSNGAIDTSNVIGSAVDSGPASIAFFSGDTGSTGSPDQSGLTTTADVTKYVNTVTGAFAPNATRTFRFRRRIN